MIRGNLPTKLLALGLAVFLWFFVRLSQETPETFRVLQNVPVQMKGKPASGFDVKLHYEDESVDLELRGPAERINSLQRNDVSVFVDVQGITDQKISVKPTVVLPAGVRLVREPTVTIQSYPLLQKTFPVSVAFITNPPPGTIVGEYSLDPPSVVVEGNQVALSQVKYVNVRLDPMERFASTRELVPRTVDASGERVPDVKVLTPTIHISMASVTGQETTRQIAIAEPVLLNLPHGYMARVKRIHPDVVTISGENDLIDQLHGFIQTDACNLAKVTSNTTLKTNLHIPQGLTVAERPVIQIDIEVHPIR